MKILVAIGALFLPFIASAATLTLVPSSANVGARDSLEVTLMLRSDVAVNAFSGALSVPQEWSVVSVSDGGSIVSAWVENPTVKNGAIEFAGVTAEGFTGERGVLFSAVLRAAAGAATISVEHPVVLRADGAGSTEPVTAPPLHIEVGPAPLGGWTAQTDSTPPEPFEPIVGDFGQGLAVAFTASDKGSGIDHFEVAERRIPFLPLKWRTEQSPSVLEDSYGTSDIYVKAVDHAGNSRIEAVHRTGLLRPGELIFGCILLVCAFFAYLLFYRHSFSRR